MTETYIPFMRKCECTASNLTVRKGEFTGKWRATCPHAYVGKAQDTADDARHWWALTAK
ncbi:MAG: hypothetical protein IT464_12650 [Planctomycetes bacterium]|nr:hypothetical protein [Planctomycetota bacterium]